MGVVLHAHPVRGDCESHIYHNAERLQYLQQGWARLFETTESERDKWNANWENLDINNLQWNLLKQYWAPFSNLSGTILWHVGCHFVAKKRHRKNVKFRVTRLWLELANQWLVATWQFLWLDSTKSWLWLGKILDDSDSTLTWWACDSDSTLTTEMTRTHHCIQVAYLYLVNLISHTA